MAPQQADPLYSRAVSYLALDKAKEAASDLDEAVQASPMNGQIWVTRGQAYEKLGDKGKAMEMLRRHFYRYERYDAVRAKEMWEARVDYVFASIKDDPEFVKLTAMAE